MSGYPSNQVGAAYNSTDPQADPILSNPRIVGTGRYAVSQTFRPYVYGLSRESLRPAI